MANRRKYDIVVFGASGFTGQFVVEEVARTISKEKINGGALKWAVAGRDMKKLQAVLKEASSQTGVDLSDLPIIIADVKSESSLNEMCQQTSLVLNCVGPYRFFGTAVVKACIENGAHHIDISGEPAWLEETELVYGPKAKDAGVYIMEACGFDSIPSDLGVVYTKKQFQGLLNSVECYITAKPGKESGPVLNYGTWHSAIYGLAHWSDLKAIRKQLFADPPPKNKHRLDRRGTVFYGDDVKGWCLPFLGADKAIVYRSQITNYRWKKLQPIQFQPYIRCGGLLSLIIMMFAGLVFGLLTKFGFGRYLLENYPKQMSLGYCSKEGPSRKQIASSSVRITFVGLGYDKADAETQSEPPKKRIVTSLNAPEPGYVTTPICMVQAAYCVLLEKDKLPPSGGVYTPGAAFGDTTLLTRIQDRGLKFSVVES